ncbi:MAG TPA: PAS domain-containing sensor histidine kinase [Gemmatimonadaceae bacterium]|nr:PAS domain-containing sensor histidine kinase [Gemmatimonadaceae bacterium]
MTKESLPAAGPQSPRIGSADLELFKLLVDTVRDYAIFALDSTGHILTWNSGAQQIKGWNASEIVGKHFSTFYPPEDLAWNKPAYELEVATREGRFEDTGWRVRKDGSRFWANVIITALRDKNGVLVGFAKVTRDLSERRRAEESLRQSEERFRLLVSSVRDYGIFLLDTAGVVISWNDGAERISGYRANEIIGQHFSVFYPEADQILGKPRRELETTADVGRFEEEGWRIRKDGSRFWSNVVITALRDTEGRLVGFAKVTRDLTERREAQERAIADARRAAEAEAANRAKTEFLAAMSHELRTPLNAIGGYADLLLAGVAGPMSAQQHEYIERLQRSQKHLLGIVSDLLNYSRIEAGQLTYDIEEVRAADAMTSVATMVRPQANMKGIRFEVVECPPTFTMRADRQKAEQILLNLLSNAVKFTESGGSVTLHCERREREVAIIVSDTGVGIPEGKLDAIFEPFVQVGRGLTTQHEGTGLGLAISRDLARAMHGNISVTSTLGRGARFVLTLPSS